jgi:acyl-CoA thioesterase
MSFPAEAGWERHRDDTFVSTLGELFLRETAEGCELGLAADARLRNRGGAVHGGVLMTLLDRAGGLLAGKAAAGARVATASLTVNFLRPVATDATIVVRSRLRKPGRNSWFTDADAFAGDTLVATATAFYMRVG